MNTKPTAQDSYDAHLAAERAKPIQYVAGFLFSPNLEEVALIRKNKPEWQKGKLNGIGGKIEEGEDSIQAMCREFSEETTRHECPQWVKFAAIGDDDTFTVTFFAALGEPSYCGSAESEKVEVIKVRSIHPLRRDMIENLPWLISLAIDHLEDQRPEFAQITYPKEAK